MSWLSISLLSIIWASAFISAITGIIWNPNVYIRRSDNPLRFWRAYKAMMFLSIIVTIAIIVSELR